MSVDLGRRLLAAGVVQPGELQRALFDALTRDRPLARALVEVSATARDLLSRPLPPSGDDAYPSTSTVVLDPVLAAELPPGLATRLLAVPVRRDPRTGTIDVAVVDPGDVHVVSELSFHLRAPVRAIAAPLPEIERALLLVRDDPAGRRGLGTTADYEAAPPSLAQESRARDSESWDGPAPSDDLVLPLVRRARPSQDAPPASIRPASIRPASIPPPSVAPPSRVRASLAPPTTTPFEARAVDTPARVQMVVDFSAVTRREREEAAPITRRGTPPIPAQASLEPKRPPFASLTPVLEAIDVARDRDGLVSALLRGLATTTSCAALFAPRRGRFVGLGATGSLSSDHVRGATAPLSGAIADAIARGERLGALDPQVDRELYAALDLARLGAAHVLLHPVFVADKVALLLVAFGTTDVLESSRRARVLATAASTALARLLRR